MLKVGIGIDVGHSRVKFGYVFNDEPKERFVDSFPTVVMDYFKHDSDETRAKIEKNDMVELEGKKYFFGDTAQTQSSANTYTGQHKEWVDSVEHDVLILGAWKRVHDEIKRKRPEEKISSYVLVFGLPTKFYSAQRDILEERVEKIITPLLEKGQKLKIIIKSQSEAPLSCIAFNSLGIPTSELEKGDKDRHQMDKESWGVIEGGFITTDFSVWHNGQIVNRLSDSASGASIVYESVDKELSGKYPTNLMGVLTEIIENGEIFHDGQVHDLSDVVERGAKKLQDTIKTKAEAVFAEHKTVLRGIIVAGGSTPLVFDALKESGYRVYTIPNIDPRNVVLEAFLRLSLYAMNVRQIV